MKIKIFLTIFATVILLQFFHTNSKAEEVKSIDDVELATIDPFVRTMMPCLDYKSSRRNR